MAMALKTLNFKFIYRKNQQLQLLAMIHFMKLVLEIGRLSKWCPIPIFKI